LFKIFFLESCRLLKDSRSLTDLAPEFSTEARVLG
jgi:hypothetical protein